MTTTHYYIGIDVGGTKILGGIVTPAGEILFQDKRPTPPKAGLKEIRALINKIIKTLLLETGLPLSAVAGIGVAIPGIVDNTGKVIATPNLGLGNSNLKNILEKELKKKVSVGNDVNLGVLGERWLGAARKAGNIVGIFPGTGIGGGLIINNTLTAGTHGAAGELGHMTIDPAGPLCTCGNKGCLEAFAGRWAIERDIRAAIKNGEQSTITAFSGKDLDRIKSSSLAKALQAKDPVVTRIMDQAARALGQACVSLNHLLDPDVFLFGGGVIEACGDFILPRVEKIIKADPFFKKLPSPRVITARLGDDAVMLGAVAMALQNAGHKKLTTLTYPLIKLSPSGEALIKGKPVLRTTLIRADGKIRELETALRPAISDKDLGILCKKGPENLFVALTPQNRTVLSPKALRLLKKKKITPRVLPVRQAIEAYNADTDRKAIVFVM